VGSGTCGSTASGSGVFYVLNQTTDQIVALKIASGSLTTIGTWTPPTSHPLAIAVAPNGKFLYVSTLSGIYLYTIGSNGALTLSYNGTYISQDPAVSMQVDSTNSWLVVAISGSSQLYAIAINSSTGALATAGESEQPFTLPSLYPVQLVISPGDSSSCANCYVFVALGSGGTEAIHFNPSPSGGNPFGGSGNPGLVNSAGGANTVAVDPSNRFLYIGETSAVSGTQTGGLRVFTIGSTGITPITGSPYATGGTGPTSILPSADGNYVYVANGTVSGSSDGNITSFSVTTSLLTSVGSIAAGTSGQLGLAEDSSGTYLLAVDLAGSPDLQIYTMSSGTLTSAKTISTGTDPVGAIAIAAAP
jgi:DNA-binding beta-propeller fold protein YncE